MRKQRTTWVVSGMALGAAIIAGCTTAPDGNNQGETLSFSADLSGAEEVPAVDTAGTASFSMTIDSGTGIGSYSVTYSDLSGPVTTAHLHLGAVGQSGAPFEDLSDDFAGDNDGSVQGAVALTASEIADIQAGNVYVNLHTDANPAGEIRGQLEESP